MSTNEQRRIEAISAFQKACIEFGEDKTEENGNAMYAAKGELLLATLQPPAPEQPPTTVTCVEGPTFKKGMKIYAPGCMIDGYIVTQGAPLADADTLRQCAYPDSATPMAAKPDNLDIHSCSPFCDRPECVADRTEQQVCAGCLQPAYCRASGCVQPEQQAQAGELNTVWALKFPGDARVNLSTIFDTEADAIEYRKTCVTSGIQIVPLITLQSHREAIAKLEGEFCKDTGTFDIPSLESIGLSMPTPREYAAALRVRWQKKLDEAIAKRDAALVACVEALKHLAHNARASGAEMGLALVVSDDAITQANEAVGRKGGGV